MNVELMDIRLVPPQCWSLALRVGLVDALLWLLTNKDSIDNYIIHGLHVTKFWKQTKIHT